MKRHVTALILLAYSGVATANAILFQDDFEQRTFGSEWVRTPGVNDGLIDIQSGLESPSGLYAVRMGKSVDGPFTVNTLDLHLDLSNNPEVEISYRMLRYYGASHQGEGVWFSDDGGLSFVEVFPWNTDDWPNDRWLQYPPLDIDKKAKERGLSLTDDFVVRFQQAGSGDFGAGTGGADGIYLDDVVVKAATPVYADLPFEDGFERADGLGPSWAWAWPDETADERYIRPTGLVNPAYTEFAHSGAFSVYLSPGSGWSTNAIDLHLNLCGGDVSLSFWLLRNWDTTDIRDGIYLSNDGGESFTKVYQLDPSNYPNKSWQQFQLDVDHLARGVGLLLTEQSVVRFQESGANAGYGFAIDDVLITGDQACPAPYGLIDIDGNGKADALTDGLLMMRFLFGFSGDALIEGAVGDGCTRCNPRDIGIYILQTLLSGENE